jgi:hypothetical protein
MLRVSCAGSHGFAPSHTTQAHSSSYLRDSRSVPKAQQGFWSFYEASHNTYELPSQLHIIERL